MIKAHLVPLFAAAIALTGCASLMGKGGRTFTLDSMPSGATVYVNGNQRGVTPFAYAYSPDDGTEVTFELRMPGYLTASTSIRPKMRNGVLFADAMLFHLPYIVDRNSPDLYMVGSTEATVRLFKELPANMRKQFVPVTGMEVLLGERAALGSLNGRQVNHDRDSPLKSLNYPDQLTASIASGARDTWMDLRTVRKGTTKGDEAIQRAKLFLHPALEGLVMDLKESKERASGKMDLTVNWRFYSSSDPDKILHEERTTTTHFANGERLDDVLSSALSSAARGLAESNTLPGRLEELYGAGLSASKGGEVRLPRPRTIAFKGRKDMLSELVKGVVTIEMDKGHGSGFVISNDGYLLTNEHVVNGESLVRVKFAQGFTLDGTVVKTNKDFDLALVKVQATDLPALALGDDTNLMLGEELFAIGTPLDTELGQSVARGVLSGRREIEGRSYLQTDVSINPGNSGGPLIDENGGVVGVTTMKISGKGLEGLGFGVPIKQVLEMLNITFEQ